VQLVQLRFRAVCAVCSSKLPPRAEAWQDPESQQTICLSCQRIEAQAQEAAEAAAAAAEAARTRKNVPDLNRAPRLVPARPGDEGAEPAEVDGSDDEADQQARWRELEAQRLADQQRIARSLAEERDAAAPGLQPGGAAPADAPNGRTGGGARRSINLPRAKRGTGGSVRPDPLSARPPADTGETRTRLPQVGPSLAAASQVERDLDEGSDNAISRALEAARPHGLEIIRSRPWAGTRVESEAIVVGPSGVWVVGGLSDADRPLERSFLAGHAGSELLNVVGGRTSIISGLLFDSPYQWVPVRGALCFDAGVPAWFEDPFALAGIAITTPRDLVDSLFMPLHLDAEARRGVAQHLVNRF
jgi:hypothetical protein